MVAFSLKTTSGARPSSAKADPRAMLVERPRGGQSCHSLRLRQCLLSKGAMQKADYAADTATL